MGFLFPLFLIAASAVLIPVIIHLVNLRRYKRELFPNVRFLKQLRIVSKSSAKLHRRWLLLTRILFLLALVTAFAQPFFKSSGNDTPPTEVVQVLYIDNSYSMSASKDGQPLLAWAKNEASKLISSGTPASRYIVLSNDHLFLSQTLNAEEAQKAINQIALSYKTVSLNQIKDLLLARDGVLTQNEQQHLYIFSDFQKATMETGNTVSDSLKNLHVFLVPLSANDLQNIFIDSAGIVSSENIKSSNKTIYFRVNREQSASEQTVPIRIWVNSQMQKASAVTFGKGQRQLTDSFHFQASENAWTNISFTVTDPALSFDDTFRMVAHVPVGYSALILSSDGKINPYLQAAFSSMPGVRLKALPTEQYRAEEAHENSLIILQNGDDLDEYLADNLKSALAEGCNILIFPGNNPRPEALNRRLKKLGDIQLQPLDTSRMQAILLQQEHPLIKGIFSSIPEQIQLPIAYNHFPVTADLSANEQDIMSFADGSPLLAAFHLEQGQLFLVTSALNGESSNFPLSYFFAPLLYRMTVPTAADKQFLTTVGSASPIWLPNTSSGGTINNIWHIYRGEKDWIPAQKSTGKGIALYAGQALAQPGFYNISQANETTDSFSIGVNTNPLESHLATQSEKALLAAFPGASVSWLDAQTISQHGWITPRTTFPLWKICVLLALACLLVETWFLWQPLFVKKSGKSSTQRLND